MRNSNKWFYLYSIIFYVVLIFIFSLASNKFIKPMSDVFLISNFASGQRVSDDIVEVIVDNNTNEKYGWTSDVNNEITADLLDYFYSYSRPKVVGIDVNFVSFKDSMVSSSKRFVSQISKMDNLVSSFVPESLNDDSDAILLKSFKQNHSLNVKFKTKIPKETEYNGVVSSSDILRNSTKNYGSVLVKKRRNSNYIYDSIYIVKIKDHYYPSLSFKMYLLANKTNDVVIGKKYIYVPKTGIKIPYKYDNGCFRTPIRFYHSRFKYGNVKSDYTHVSVQASKILDTYRALKNGITPQTNPERYDFSKGDLVNPELFNNMIVFIGANISGPSDDVLMTPIHNRHPGVDIQATSYDNLHKDSYLENTNIWLIAFFYGFLCVSAFVIIIRTSFLKGLLSVFFIDIIYLLIVFVLAAFGYITGYASPLVCQLATAIFAYTFKFLNESRNKEKIKNAMGKYLSQDIMKNVVKNIDDLKLGGKRAVVTVLFSDIRGFTSMSEKMSAEEVSAILNEYFGEMEPIISKYNGVINKFIGDAIMAIFGEPIQDSNHPQNAVKCAYEMLKKVEYLKEKWISEGKPKFEIGVGVNTGEVFIGNIGTETRMEYTVIGDTVNLASRIEGYNKVYKTNLLVSSSTYSYISDIADVIKIKEVQIRGKSKKMDIYEVLRIEK